jgi:hypothetical protein
VEEGALTRATSKCKVIDPCPTSNLLDIMLMFFTEKCFPPEYSKLACQAAKLLRMVMT